jgi:hypothetical protein
VTWEQGRDAVESMLARGHLERVPANPDDARYLLARAATHLESAARMADSDLGSPTTPSTPPPARAPSPRYYDSRVFAPREPAGTRWSSKPPSPSSTRQPDRRYALTED